MMTTTTAVPAETLHDVQAVLAGAWEHLGSKGWARFGPTIDTSNGVRLVDALNYASAHAGVDRRTHLLVFACAAMAIEPHAGIAAHELLPEQLADRYLDPGTSDDDLHRLDASIVVRYNTDRCAGYEDARNLLHTAYTRAAEIIVMQLDRPDGAR